jgi:hypothetical protein
MQEREVRGNSPFKGSSSRKMDYVNNDGESGTVLDNKFTIKPAR